MLIGIKGHKSEGSILPQCWGNMDPLYFSMDFLAELLNLDQMTNIFELSIQNDAEMTIFT